MKLRDISISKKLSIIIIVFSLVIFLMLSLSYVGFELLSAVRGYVEGESLWSKAEKDAMFHLSRYASTHDEMHYEHFVSFMDVTLEDRKGRLELLKSKTDLNIVDQAFIEGGNHPDDVRPMGYLFKYFQKISYIDKAIKIRTESDKFIDELIVIGKYMNVIITSSPSPDQAKLDDLLDTALLINADLTKLEDDFSFTLGEAARWFKGILEKLMFTTTLIFLILGIFISALISRYIIRGARLLEEGSERVAKSNFSQKIEFESEDELGKLAFAFNNMAVQLQELYSTLEKKVKDRTEELAQAKARDDAILESIGDGLVFIDLARKVVIANKAAEEILGWKESEMIGKLWDELVDAKDEKGKKIPLETLPTYKILASKTPATITTAASDSYYYTKRDGTVFPVAITASNLLDTQPLGIILVFRDITRDKEVDRAKSEFVSLASHQLKTPPTAIHWLTERLLSEKTGKLTAKQTEYFNDIRKINQRMIELVNALLNVSRIELGEFAIKPVSKDPCEVVNSVVQELTPLIKNKKIIIKESLQSHRQSMIDVPLFRMVVYNLIANSIQYTPDNGEIRIECKHSKSGEMVGERTIKEDSFILVVSDNGCGIPKHQQDKIFTKFFRADNAKAIHTYGTGLGLYIVKSILDHSGGSIWFISEENKGAEFYVATPSQGMRQKEGAKMLEMPRNQSF